MSYSISLEFNARPCLSKGDAFDMAISFAENLTVPENAMKLIKDNLNYFPSERESLDGMTSPTAGDRCFLDQIFSPRFIFWERHNIFAVVGDYDISDSLYSYILFQNSCDKDYDYDVWSVLPFKTIAKAVENREMDSQIIEKYTDGRNEHEIHNDIDYFRKSFLYEYIEEKLCIHDILNDTDSNEFMRFSINALNSRIKHIGMEKLLMVAIKEKQDEDRDYWRSVLESPDKLEAWYKRIYKRCNKDYSIEEYREDIRKLAEGK